MDFDGGQALGHYLKIWADRYACTGETKGGTIPLNHDKFIVTSNYSIADIFGPEVGATGKAALARMELVKAMARRFEVVHMDRPYNPVAAPSAPPRMAIEEEEKVPVPAPKKPAANPFARVNPVHYKASQNKRIAKMVDKGERKRVERFNIVDAYNKKAPPIEIEVGEIEPAAIEIESDLDAEDIAGCLSE